MPYSRKVHSPLSLYFQDVSFSERNGFVKSHQDPLAACFHGVKNCFSIRSRKRRGSCSGNLTGATAKTASQNLNLEAHAAFGVWPVGKRSPTCSCCPEAIEGS